MPDPISILIFNENEGERHALTAIIKTRDNKVFDTSDALAALRILQKENIGVVLAGRETGISPAEFKGLVEKIKPGVSVIFTSPFSPQENELSVNIDDFLKLIKHSVSSQNRLCLDLNEMRQFSYTLADRLLQLLAVNEGHFLNNNRIVAELSGRIAAKMGLEENIVEAIRMAALLRDLGMVLANKRILEEPKKLDQAELAPIRTHPLHTAQILRQVRFPWDLDTIISQHHENYDGSGYPIGLKGREISIGARIIHVAGAYYAITTDRPYRKALHKDNAVAEIKRNAGSQFDPEVLQVFFSIIGDEASESPVRKRVLIFERELNVAAMVRLGTASGNIEVIHATSSISAISRIRHKNPQVIVADADTLEPETFKRFYHTARQTAGPGRHLLLLVQDKEFIDGFNECVEYIIKPIQMEQITVKIRGLLSDVSPHVPQEEVRELAGKLEDCNLTDIIRVLSCGLQTAKVEVTRDDEKGVLYLLRGKIVHASAGNIKGPDAFFELMRWERGTFLIRHDEIPIEENVALDTTYLLAGGRAQLNETHDINNPNPRDL